MNRQAAGQLRTLEIGSGIDFVSNDYLGLSHHPSIIEASIDATKQWGVGAPGARLLGGHREIHERAERAVASWLATEAALLLPSGWHANQAALGALIGPDDAAFCDERNHASLIDAVRLTGCTRRIYRHADTTDLRRQLRATRVRGRFFIVTDAMFSMDATKAPVDDLIALAEAYNAYLWLDEAHSVGVFGDQGRGLGQAFVAHPLLLGRTITGGKALGGSGAFIAASQLVVDTVVNHGRGFIYTTAVPPPTAAALHAAVTLDREPLRNTLWENVALLRGALQDGGIEAPGEGPIVPVIVGPDKRALHVADNLRAAGYDVRAVRPPTVPEGTSRVRLVVHASQTKHELESIVGVLRASLGKCAPASVEARPASMPIHPRGVYVVGTDTGIGKTMVSALLMRDLVNRQHAACYLKPVQTGDDSDTETVASLSKGETIGPALSLALPASVDQAAEAEGKTITANEVLGTCRKWLDAKHTWVVEGAGGLLVPLNDAEDQSGLIRGLKLPTLLVARSALGTLNHTLLSIEAMKKRGIDPVVLVLVGPRHLANEKTLKNRLAIPIISMPMFADLEPMTHDAWLATNPWEDLWTLISKTG